MLRRRTLHVVAAAFGVLALALACAPSTGETDSSSEQAPDRATVFQQLGEQVIAPTLERFATDAETLRTRASAFCETRDAGRLAAAQDAWRATRAPWSTSAAFAFGPVTALGVQSAIDFWPARPDDVEEALALADSIDTTTVDGYGATRKGLPVIEYLLFGDARDSAAVLAGFVDAAGDLRCDYLEALTTDLHARATALHGAWVDAGGHLEQFVGAGHGSAVYPKEQDAVDIVVNALVSALTFAVQTKLDKPIAGLSEVESPFSDNALTDLRANLEGVAALYHGALPGDADADADTPGLDTLVRFVDPALDDRVDAQLDATVAALDAVAPPLRLALTEDAAAVTHLRDEVDALRRLFKLEVVSALSVTLSLTDNDGD